ncbi:uncharacterized protein [Choristoneura fumiferana]|uniref:uncharacterized protein n=1 Tax=Choristoneura fumiferana TaxID=7141 RepID=UPI003D157C37
MADVDLEVAKAFMFVMTYSIIEDDNLRSQLANDDATTVVFKYRKTIKKLVTEEEKEILSEIVEALPEIESIDPEKFKDIRKELRNGYKNSWVLYFSKNEDRLLLHQMRIKFPILHFGEIDCEKWLQLCLSLQVEETPAWALLKPGGGYQKARRRGTSNIP